MITIKKNPETVGKLKVGTSSATPADGELLAGAVKIAQGGELVIDKAEAGSGTIRFYKGGSASSYIQYDASENLVHYMPSSTGEQQFYTAGNKRLAISSTGRTDVTANANGNWAFKAANAHASGLGAEIVIEGSTASETAFEVKNNGSHSALKIDGTGLATFGVGIALQTSPSNDSATASEAYTLDRYETGTFTLADGSGAGLTLVGGEGKYTRIGDRVLITVNVAVPTTSNANGLRFTGLPFNAPSDDDARGLSISFCNKSTIAYSLKETANDAVSFYTDAGGTVTNANASGGALYISGHYKV